MLVPLVHTCATVIYVYSNIIPNLPEEEGSLITCYLLLASPVLVVLLTVLQHFIFTTYNTSGHTWKKLLCSRRVFHVAVCLVGSSWWKTQEVEERLREVWQDLREPRDGEAKVRKISVERLASWGQSAEEEKDLWKGVVTVSPDLDFSAFEAMTRSSEYYVKQLVREELRSGVEEEEEEEEEEEADTTCCMCSCIPKVWSF